jgi:tetratricopeptide (TPR) repeat protein
MVHKLTCKFLWVIFFTCIFCSCKDYESIYEEGRIKLNLSYYGAAIKDFDKCIKLDDQKELAFHSRGLAYYYLHNLKQAEKDFLTALLLDPTCSDLHYNYGCLLYDQKKDNLAKEYLSKAWELVDDTMYGHITNKLAWIAYRTDLSNEEALQYFDRSIENNKYDSEAYFGKAYILYNKLNLTMNQQQISSYLNTAITLNYKYAEAYYYRALVHLETNQRDSAVSDLRKSVKYGFKQAQTKINELGLK